MLRQSDRTENIKRMKRMQALSKFVIGIFTLDSQKRLAKLNITAHANEERKETEEKQKSKTLTSYYCITQVPSPARFFRITASTGSAFPSLFAPSPVPCVKPIFSINLLPIAFECCSNSA